MNGSSSTDGWFMHPPESQVDALKTGRADQPEHWPQLAVEAGMFADETQYYERLHAVCVQAARGSVAEREGADDQQLIHAVRAVDDLARTTNELVERVAEWAGTHDSDAQVDIAYLRTRVASEETQTHPRVQSLAERVVALDDEREQLRRHIERTAPEVAPNLTALAGPMLAARLIALAGSLETLAKKPAGTVQVLGAEDALFAHLRGNAAPPKHGIIYTHEAVRGTSRGNRGSAARALAGKLSIAARVDYYTGELRPELETDLATRIKRIQERDSQ